MKYVCLIFAITYFGLFFFLAGYAVALEYKKRAKKKKPKLKVVRGGKYDRNVRF